MTAYAFYLEALCIARDRRYPFEMRCRARGVARLWRRILMARSRAATQYAA